MTIFNFLNHIIGSSSSSKSSAPATHAYVCNAKAMAATPADVKEFANAYSFIVDMPGVKPGDIQVQVEDDNLLVISGEQKQEVVPEGAKYVRMERTVGKFMWKFVLPENTDVEMISAESQDGVVTVTMPKKLPPS